MLIKQIMEVFDVLDSSTVTGKSVEEYLRSIKADANIEVYALKGPKGESTAMVKVRIPGTKGKTGGPFYGAACLSSGSLFRFVYPGMYLPRSTAVCSGVCAVSSSSSPGYSTTFRHRAVKSDSGPITSYPKPSPR